MPPAPPDWLDILGESPAGVERQAVADHELAAQQCLESRERGQHVHLVHLLEEPAHRDLGEHLVTPVAHLPLALAARPQARGHVGMRLVQQVAVRVCLPHRPYQADVGAQRGRTEAQRRVRLHLPRHEDHPRAHRPAPGPLPHAVLGDAGCNDALAQRGGARQQLRRELAALQQLLQIRGAGGVVIDAGAIQDPRHRTGELRPQAHGSQESVLDPDERDIRGEARRRGSASPQQQGRARRYAARVPDAVDDRVAGEAPQDASFVEREAAGEDPRRQLHTWRSSPSKVSKCLAHAGGMKRDIFRSWFCLSGLSG